jgi:WD40 repeat protein
VAVASHRWPGYAVDLLDATGGKGRRSLTGSAGSPWSLAFGPDGQALAVGWDRGTDLWDVPQRKVRRQLVQSSPVRALAWSPDGRTLASSARQVVTLWDAAAGRTRAMLSEHERMVNGLAFSPEGRTLASASSDGTVRLWDAASGRQCAAFNWQIGQVYAVAIAPDAMRAAAGGEADIVVWDLDDGA